MMKRIGIAMIVVGAAWCVLGAGAAEPSTEPAKELTLDLGNGVKMKLTLIPAGKFLMGSPDEEQKAVVEELVGPWASESAAWGAVKREGPRHSVTISRPFYMGIFEVTQEQYEAVMGANPSAFKSKTNPVEMISWNDAAEFCKRISAKAGRTICLPTEAQWEYACRSGAGTRFCFGDNNDDLCRYGNYCDKSNTLGKPWQDKDHTDGFDKTAAAGSFKPNDFGLYDMHGNVWEWCADWYADSYVDAGTKDPAGPGKGLTRVLRGGSWLYNPAFCRAAVRNWYEPDFRANHIGFRVVGVAAAN